MIETLIDIDAIVDITAYTFRYLDTDATLHINDSSEFLKEYFVNVAERKTAPLNNNAAYSKLYQNCISIYDFSPPTQEEIYGYMLDIDTNTFVHNGSEYQNM